MKCSSQGTHSHLNAFLLFKGCCCTKCSHELFAHLLQRKLVRGFSFLGGGVHRLVISGSIVSVTLMNGAVCWKAKLCFLVVHPQLVKDLARHFMMLQDEQESYS